MLCSVGFLLVYFTLKKYYQLFSVLLTTDESVMMLFYRSSRDHIKNTVLCLITYLYSCISFHPRVSKDFPNINVSYKLHSNYMTELSILISRQGKWSYRCLGTYLKPHRKLLAELKQNLDQLIPAFCSNQWITESSLQSQLKQAHLSYLNMKLKFAQILIHLHMLIRKLICTLLLSTFFPD